MIPTAPLRPRNRLAALILDALHDEEAREELWQLASAAEPPPGWLEPEQAGHAGRLLTRARAAVAALRDIEMRPGGAGPPALAQALEWARLLFDAGLHFEAHEVLEPHWSLAEGPARETLQGLIQIAVGFQHVANANLAGGRALLSEGAARLRRGHLDGLQTEPFAARIEDAVANLSTLSRTPPFPRYAAKAG